MTDRTVYRTVAGVELRLHPVSQVLIQSIKTGTEAEFRERGEPVDPPAYTAETATGEVETHPHTPETLETDADRAAWAAHQEALGRLRAETNRRVTRVLLTKGLVGVEGPDEAWCDAMRALGVRLSDDPLERQIEYLQMEVLITPQDVQGVVAAILELSWTGVRQEVIDAVGELFRGALQRQGARAAADLARELDLPPAPGGDAGGAGLGADAPGVVRPG